MKKVLIMLTKDVVDTEDVDKYVGDADVGLMKKTTKNEALNNLITNVELISVAMKELF